MKKISVIIPCYNEEENILPMYERLKKVFEPLTHYDYEFVYVNNGSTDHSDRIFHELAGRDKKVVVIFLSRNFYKSQGAFTCGLDFAQGDAAILLDGDLQDPPEVIPALIKKWEEGHDIVLGERVKRKGSLLRRIAYKFFYRIFKGLSYINIPLDVGDFSLLDKKVVSVFKKLPERNRYIRGLRAWVGFKTASVSYTRDERLKGITTNSLYNNIEWALFAVFSFSYVPLRIISILAFLALLLIGLLAVVYTALYFMYPELAPRGFQTLFLSIFALGALQLLCFAIISEYLIIMFEEIKGRPKYIINNILNNSSNKLLT
ncbi:MAG: glycosyltransferase family 2 protein [Deltaproteobacteria bacterium]|nr:glycosyltransferase family 2 protein [Deltaproteobacteria bacterium]